jgi:hypothetical protein
MAPGQADSISLPAVDQLVGLLVEVLVLVLAPGFAVSMGFEEPMEIACVAANAVGTHWHLPLLWREKSVYVDG